jgi:hypothetical protein
VRPPERAGLRLLVSVLAALCLAPCAAAGPGLLVGLADDTGRWMEPARSLTPVYRRLGVQAVRATLQWRTGQVALSDANRVELDRLLVATRGLRLVVAVDGRGDRPPADAAGREQYCAFVASLLRAYEAVNDVVIWTEPNTATFWRPQAGAPAAYEALLARCYDVIHTTRPAANVIAASAPHQDPAAWFRGVGAALHASRRRGRIFDTVGHNAYPQTSAESPAAKHRGHVLDQGDYDRLVTVLRAAFAGTGQPAPGRGGVSIWYMEDGFQSVPRAEGSYRGWETDVSAISEEKQAEQVGAAIRLAYCQPLVGAWFGFELRDEQQLSRWQSGLLRPDWTKKPAFDAFRSALVDVVGRSVVCR